jgi:hypothetical protein
MLLSPEQSVGLGDELFAHHASDPGDGRKRRQGLLAALRRNLAVLRARHECGRCRGSAGSGLMVPPRQLHWCRPLAARFPRASFNRRFHSEADGFGLQTTFSSVPAEKDRQFKSASASPSGHQHKFPAREILDDVPGALWNQLRPWIYTPGEPNFEVGFHLVQSCCGIGPRNGSGARRARICLA